MRAEVIDTELRPVYHLFGGENYSGVDKETIVSAGYIVVTLVFQKAGKRWTARCEERGTAIFARSLPEAEKRIKEAVLLHLDTLEDVGERERFFKEHKIQFLLTKPRDIKVCATIGKEAFFQPYVQAVA